MALEGDRKGIDGGNTRQYAEVDSFIQQGIECFFYVHLTGENREASLL